MDRRHFIKLAASAPLAASLFSSELAWAESRRKIVVMIQLTGGNDGLNMVVPHGHRTYYDARPSLAIAGGDVVKLNPEVGLNPGLRPLEPIWKAKELAVIKGVGYPTPNRSHFRSTDIWETGSNSDQYLANGWLTRLLAANRRSTDAADAFVLGKRDVGPLRGSGVSAVVMKQPDELIKQADEIHRRSTHTDNPALNHILDVQNEVVRAADQLREKLANSKLDTPFPRHGFGRRMELAANLVVAGIETPVLVVPHKGFDTHRGQDNVHTRLMRQLGEGLAAFREAVQRAGRWDDVVVMTYSEFGRRVAENASGGTDHGTAAPHFLMGGRVKGGLYGKQPSLTDLDDGDLRYNVHYRSLYATVAAFWGISASFDEPAIRCIS